MAIISNFYLGDRHIMIDDSSAKRGTEAVAASQKRMSDIVSPALDKQFANSTQEEVDEKLRLSRLESERIRNLRSTYREA